MLQITSAVIINPFLIFGIHNALILLTKQNIVTVTHNVIKINSIVVASGLSDIANIDDIHRIIVAQKL